jgi:dihydrolipoamide dehydrogenase
MYDLIVIGTGPGGYVCPIRAGWPEGRGGRRATHGSTCLNVGCIPSRGAVALRRCSRGRSLAKMGIGVGTPKLDLAALMSSRTGVDGGIKGVAPVEEQDRCGARRRTRLRPGKVEVKGTDGKTQTLETKYRHRRLGCGEA